MTLSVDVPTQADILNRLKQIAETTRDNQNKALDQYNIMNQNWTDAVLTAAGFSAGDIGMIRALQGDLNRQILLYQAQNPGTPDDIGYNVRQILGPLG